MCDACCLEGPLLDFSLYFFPYLSSVRSSVAQLITNSTAICVYVLNALTFPLCLKRWITQLVFVYEAVFCFLSSCLLPQQTF